MNTWLSGARKFWRVKNSKSRPPKHPAPQILNGESSVSSPPMRVEDLDVAAKVINEYSTRVGSPWDQFRERYIPLPQWFDSSLDPFSSEYALQQDRIWEWVSGRSSYSAVQQEQTPEIATYEHIYRPAFYVLRGAGTMAIAGDHLIAMGHFLKRSGIVAKDRVLEYGAGFGQTALAFARMGAVVDTVDIDPNFCKAVQAQADFFKVPLTAFTGEFGYNPRPGEKYRLIFFYESFHHCREFIKVIGQLREHLTADGKIMMAGEPITTDYASPSVPYPWGLRLDAETTAVVRWRGWYELGFQEDFLVQCFIRNGFVYHKYPSDISDFAIIYEFKLRPNVIEMENEQMAPLDSRTWHEVDPSGRWTRDHSTMTLDTRGSHRALKITVMNHHPKKMQVDFRIGTTLVRRDIKPLQHSEIEISSSNGYQLEISCNAISPEIYGSADHRVLGIFVEKIEYLN